MSSEKAQRPLTDQEIRDMAMNDHIRMLDRTIDAIYITAGAMGRINDLAQPDIPRLCVSAGLRTLEKMIEYHARKLTRDAEGIEPYPEAERTLMAKNIIAAADDAENVMVEALETTRRIRESQHHSTH